MYQLYPCTTAEQLFQVLLDTQKNAAIGLSVDLVQSRFVPRPKMLFQNNALGEWFKVRLAQEQGISIGLSVGHTQEILEHYLAYFFAELQGGDSQEETGPRWIHQDIISLRLFLLLSDAPEGRLPKSLHNTLEKTSVKELRERHLWSFSQTMGQLFVNYDSYRRELTHILNPEHWQKELWQSVQEGFFWHGQLIEQILLEGRQPLNELEPLYILGSGFLSAQQQRFYCYLAQFVPVYHFWLAPAHFPKGLRDLAVASFLGKVETPLSKVETKSDYESKLQELIAALGGLPQFLWLENSLHSAAVLTTNSVEWQSDTVDSGSETQGPQNLLNFVQQSLRDCALAKIDGKNVQLDDGSIQFFACSDKRREIEVLKDQILAALDANPEWQLNDIAILAPDINQYQALIQGIFLDAPYKLNCNFIDLQAGSSQSTYLQAFHMLLGFSQSRFSLDECLQFLENPCCQASLLLEQKPDHFWRKVFLHWKVSWGMDQAQKAQILSEQGVSKIGTWKGALSQFIADYLSLSASRQSGLQALCMKMMFTEAEAQLIADVLDFILRLDQHFSSRHSISEWVQHFETLQDQFLLCRDGEYYSDQRDRSLINKSLRNFLAIEESLEESLKESLLNGLNTKKLRFPFAVMQSLLKQKLEQSYSCKGRYLTQGITCASLQPYRSVPFRMICVLGLSEKDFPRSSNALRFDLSAELSQYLNRQTQEQHIFAEILISARERLLLSYQNRDLEKGIEKQASASFHDLAFFIADRLGMQEQEIWQNLLQTHPVFPFDLVYFKDSEKFFTYSQRAFLQQQAQREQKAVLETDKIQYPVVQQAAVLNFDDVVAVLKDAPSFFWNLYSGLGSEEPEKASLSELLPHGEELLLKGLQPYNKAKWQSLLWNDPQLFFALSKLSAGEFQEFIELEGLLRAPLLQQMALYGKGLQEMQEAFSQATFVKDSSRDLPLFFQGHTQYDLVLDEKYSTTRCLDCDSHSVYFLPALKLNDFAFTGKVDRVWFDREHMFVWNRAPFQFSCGIYHLVQQSFLHQICEQCTEFSYIQNITQIIWDYKEGFKIEECTDALFSLEDWAWLVWRASCEPLPLSSKFFKSLNKKEKGTFMELYAGSKEKLVFELCRALEKQWQQYLKEPDYSGSKPPEAYRHLKVSFGSETLQSQRFWSIFCGLIAIC